MTDYELGVTANLVQAFAASAKSQLSVMEVDGPDVLQYGVVVPIVSGVDIVGLVEKPMVSEALSNLASIGRHVLAPDHPQGIARWIGRRNTACGCNQHTRAAWVSGNGAPQWPAFRLQIDRGVYGGALP